MFTHKVLTASLHPLPFDWVYIINSWGNTGCRKLTEGLRAVVHSCLIKREKQWTSRERSVFGRQELSRHKVHRGKYYTLIILLKSCWAYLGRSSRVRRSVPSWCLREAELFWRLWVVRSCAHSQVGVLGWLWGGEASKAILNGEQGSGVCDSSPGSLSQGALEAVCLPLPWWQPLPGKLVPLTRLLVLIVCFGIHVIVPMLEYRRPYAPVTSEE